MKQILKTTVDDDLKLKFEARARERGKSSADLLRDVIDNYLLRTSLFPTDDKPVAHFDNLSDQRAADYFRETMEDIHAHIGQLPGKLDDLVARNQHGLKEISAALLRMASDIRAHAPVLEKLAELKTWLTKRFDAQDAAFADSQKTISLALDQKLGRATMQVETAARVIEDNSQIGRVLGFGVVAGMGALALILAALPAHWSVTRFAARAVLGETASETRAAAVLLSKGGSADAALLQATSIMLEDPDFARDYGACVDRATQSKGAAITCKLDPPPMYPK